MNFERRIKRLLSTVKHTLTLIVQTIRLILIQKLIVLWSLKKIFMISTMFLSCLNHHKTHKSKTQPLLIFTLIHHTHLLYGYTQKRRCVLVD